MPLIDWVTVVLDSPLAKDFCRRRCPGEVVGALFPDAALAVGALRDVPRNYYPRSARLVDRTGTDAGFVAVRDDGAVQIVLSGQGAQHVEDWTGAADRVDTLGGHLSRVDIAVDDVLGAAISVPRFKALQEAGAFVGKGRPPGARFLDDMGSGKGCSLYVGRKGHKELCVYEKGKQLGDPTSAYTRCEVRLYGKRLVLTTDVLRTPGRYFAGAYLPLQGLVGGTLSRLEVKAVRVDVNARSMVRAVQQQSGRALGLLDAALGEQVIPFLAKEVFREGRPQRFRNVPGDLPSLVREQLARDLPCRGGCEARSMERETPLDHVAEPA